MLVEKDIFDGSTTGYLDSLQCLADIKMMPIWVTAEAAADSTNQTTVVGQPNSCDREPRAF